MVLRMPYVDVELVLCCSSVEVVFAARLIPNEHDMAVLKYLVSRHLRSANGGAG